MRVPEDEWRPIGVEDLEPAAWAALRSQTSTYVVAGPGVGKTEFLAQKAAYLLQTGLCPPPFQILAISFKKDAATNLSSRVASRCTPHQSSRFRSLTFEAFAKGLVDRFLESVPNQWRPTRDYSIVFPTKGNVGDFLYATSKIAPSAWRSAIFNLKREEFEQMCVGRYRLPVGSQEPTSAIEFAAQAWWADHLPEGKTSRLTFIMLNRLAELILRSRPRITTALRMTYPVVFLDEFQDATHAQYDFLLTAFHGSEAVLTAVGDEKQRIMGWAGARRDVFTQFAADFAAKRIDLTMNYRSTNDLVKIQHVVARALDQNAATPVAHRKTAISDEAAQIWRFKSQFDEAGHLATWVKSDMATRGLHPRDYVLLTRQKPEQYEDQFAAAFSASGLRIRNEAKHVGKTTLQDLLAEEFTLVASALLRLAAQSRAPDAWAIVMDAIHRLRDVADDDEREAKRASDQLNRFLLQLREYMKQESPSEETAGVVTENVVAFLELDAFRRAYRSYAVGDVLKISHEAFKEHLSQVSASAETWLHAVDAFDGLGQVPLMTVHKSKGLEYDTTIFVGLDDEAWWSHSPGNEDGLATFFVALSRAKQRAIFTYCDGRGRSKVRDLYELLADAGVNEHQF